MRKEDFSLEYKLSSKRPKYKVKYRENILDKFCGVRSNQDNLERKYFSQLWEGYAWAAIIGFTNDKRVPLTPGGNDSAFSFSVINDNGGDLADSLIMLAMTKSKKNAESLIDADEIIKIIEEYTNGGFEIIQSKLMEDETHFDNPDSFIDELLQRE